MTKRGRPKDRLALEDAIVRQKDVPFALVLDELDALGPYTKPMFGCTAVYVEDKIVFILRKRPSHRDDNGVWVATTTEHHESLRTELPSLQSIGVLSTGGVTGWQNLPESGADFEEEVLRACALVRAGDARIGKVPQRRAPTKKRASRAASKPPKRRRK